MNGVNRHSPNEYVPVSRPMLPKHGKILKYLRRIDESRIYSNFGPLAREFEARLCAELGVADDSIVTAGSGTAALIAAMLACARNEGGKRRLAMMPSYTFVATAVAAERCGLQPYLLDVDPISWGLDATNLAKHPMLDQVAIIIPVAPFGKAQSHAEWLEFQSVTGIPVVFDNAAAFAIIYENPNRYLGPVPTVFSFHATKSFGIGEGGAVVSTDASKIAAITAALNFGFYGSRDSLCSSINGKMSEYSAAIGLAALEGWTAKRDMLRHVAENYRKCFAAVGLSDRFIGFPEIDGSYALFRCETQSEASGLQQRLTAGNIDHRFWYGKGVHAHGHFTGLLHDPLPNAETLGGTLLGIPMIPDMSLNAIGRVVSACAAIGKKRLFQPPIMEQGKNGLKDNQRVESHKPLSTLG